MPTQQQFLDVMERDEAERRFWAALAPRALPAETVALEEALGRVLACDAASPHDIPGFDRSNFDGFAVKAADTYGAREETPRRLRVAGPAITPGHAPQAEVAPGWTLPIATGGAIPRGADAVVLVEHTDLAESRALSLSETRDASAPQEVLVRRGVAAGHGITFTGSDIARGEVVLRQGEWLTSRETGVLAAMGIAFVSVVRRPRVAILSTGEELVAPGGELSVGKVFDSNGRALADAVRELGCEPLLMGVFPDDPRQLTAALAEALARADAIVLSGGTSKGEGDVSYRVVRDVCRPGVVAHGVALKPGKPLCLAVHDRKPVAVLPGFPTSAIFTFHDLVAPVLRCMAGLSRAAPEAIRARLAVKLNSEIGRTEFVLVGLVASGAAAERNAKDAKQVQDAPIESPRLAVAHGAAALTAGAAGTAGAAAASPTVTAFPLGKGSGSVTAYAKADGFLTIAQEDELAEAGSVVSVTLLGRGLLPADLVVIGSHCQGLDLLLGELQKQGVRTKFLAVGSTAGLEAAARGECDVAGIHLLDARTGEYNRPFMKPELALLRGYGRQQGILYRPGDTRFVGKSVEQAMQAALADLHCLLVNRNTGSGTRILLDLKLAGAQPPGYAMQVRNHNAVAAAIAQERADWGVAIASAALAERLEFIPLAAEQFDFAVPRSRCGIPSVRMFAALLRDPAIHSALQAIGMAVRHDTGEFAEQPE